MPYHAQQVAAVSSDVGTTRTFAPLRDRSRLSWTVRQSAQDKSRLGEPILRERQRPRPAVSRTAAWPGWRAHGERPGRADSWPVRRARPRGHCLRPRGGQPGCQGAGRRASFSCRTEWHSWQRAMRSGRTFFSKNARSSALGVTVGPELQTGEAAASKSKVGRYRLIRASRDQGKRASVG